MADANITGTLSLNKIATSGSITSGSITKTVSWQNINSITDLSISINVVKTSIPKSWNAETGEPTSYEVYTLAGANSADGTWSNVINNIKYKAKPVWVLSAVDDEVSHDGTVS